MEPDNSQLTKSTGSSELGEVLRSALADMQDPRYQRQLDGVMGETAKKAIAKMSEFLDDADPRVRNRGLRAFTKMMDQATRLKRAELEVAAMRLATETQIQGIRAEQKRNQPSALESFLKMQTMEENPGLR